jgi:hypothetical protein
LGHMSDGGSHYEHMGIFFPTLPAHQIVDHLAGEPGAGPAFLAISTGGLAVGGPEHMIASHLAGPPVHPVAHTAAHLDAGETGIQPSTVPSADESSQAGAATAQPNPPAASPLRPRPPGAAGPGRPMFGWSGPGQPGPGRPPSPRW